MARLTKDSALALAVKLWGRTAAVRDLGTRCGYTAESRATASTALKEHRENKPTFLALDEWPADATVGLYRETLRQHNADVAAWRKRESEMLHKAITYRCTVGTLGICFFVKGQGDTWEEAFHKAGVTDEQINPRSAAAKRAAAALSTDD